MPTKKQALVIAMVAVGVIGLLNWSRRVGAPALVAKVPLVGPIAAVTLYG